MILEEIAQKTRNRIQNKKEEVSLDEIKKLAFACHIDQTFPFERSLRKEGLHFICEVKKASPSKGVIVEQFPYLEIAKEYEEAGASAISVLTEPFYFKGDDSYLSEIAEQVAIPILRKDFTIDPYMIYEAKVLGANAVLLICAILQEEELKQYLGVAQELGLSAVVEAHDEQEVEMALRCQARIIGVNNRNLKDFTVDIQNSIQLRKQIPKSIIFISESGMRNYEDIQRLRENGTNAVLIGETLMKASDKKVLLQEWSR